MRQTLWMGILFSLCAIIAYLAYHSFYESRPPLSPFKESPKVRILLKSKCNTVTLGLPSGKCEVLAGKADRPYHLKSKHFTASYKEGFFYFAGVKHGEKVDFIEIRSEDNRIKYLKGLYKGVLRLLASKDGTLKVILSMEMEPYIARVLDGEMHSNWPMETLKAQAVSARSYALFHMEFNKNRSYDLHSSSRSQSFSNTEPSYRARKATLESFGLVMEKNNQLFPAYYVNTCGGRTNPIRYKKLILQGVDCRFCKKSPYYSWEYQMKFERVSEIFSKWLKSNFKIKSIAIKNKNKKRVVEFKGVKGSVYYFSLNHFRKKMNKAFSRQIVKSMVFSLSTRKEELFIKGNGWGYHGMGLCQYGAKQMGKELYTFEEILKYYYPGNKLVLMDSE